ncbi:hypothetical protein Tco_0581463 [Tanacetum coccineum]
MQNPGDISNLTTALDMTLELMSKEFQLNNTTPTNNNQRSSSNPCYSQIAQSGMNIYQDRQILMVDDNVGNQFRQNAVQNVGHLVGQNVVQNLSIQNVGNHNRLSVVPGIENQHGNGNVIAQKEEAGIQLNSEEFEFMAAVGAYYEIKEVNANCTLKDNLQQASTSGTQTDKAPVYDSDGSAEQKQQSLYNGKGLLEKHDPPAVYDSEETLQLAQESQAAKFVRDFQSLAKEADKSLAKHKALELEIERILRVVVSQDIMSIVQNPSVVDSSNLQNELDRTKERFKNCIIKKENEYAKLWNDWYKKCKECKYDKISYDKAYNDTQQKIKRLQAQLGDRKGKSKDTPCVSNTLDPLSQKLENENIELKYQLRAQLFDKVFEQKDTTCETSANTKFVKQSILRKPPSSPRPKLYAVTPLPKSMAFPKVGKSNALSKPVTLNSAPSSRESTVVNNERVIAPGIFRINPFKASRIDNFVPNKHVKPSVRTNSITVSQPHDITKNDVNSKTNGFFPKDSKSTTRTRRP